MPQKEVAKRMGITLNALEGILKRARKWMIKRYKDQYDRLHDI
ncbi:sigma-70 family RNA polymerase sigma factor [Dorea longicatena]|nr:sigma-70 family RNA polymerase sigma factor [Dorea longicatena]